MKFLNNIINNVTNAVGIEIEDDFTKMIRARDNGEQWAQAKLDNILQRNEPDIYERIAEARRKIYAEYAENGNPKAMYYYGISALDFNTFMRMLEPLANCGNVDAMTSIARQYSLGLLTQADEEESFKWYLKAAKFGDVFAQNQVALAYTCNNGCGGIDYNKAYEWYRAAAEQQSASGYCGMGKCYEYWQTQLPFTSNGQDINEKLLDYDQKRIDCYEEARKYLSSQDEEIETLYGLAASYRSAGEHVANEEASLQMNKLAIFYFYAAYDCGHPYAMIKAREIAENNKIYVDFNNVVGWARSEGIVE